MPEFTRDFFTINTPNFEQIRAQYGLMNRVLEIGSYQGRSACWMLENFIANNGTLICIDPFTHLNDRPFSTDYPHEGNPDIAARFWRNIDEFKKPGQAVELMISRSYPALAELITQKQLFDFIYIDGNHSAPTALADACMCFGLVKVGGIILFDDYLKDNDGNILDGCKVSIDAFTNLFSNYSKIIVNNYQVGIIRTK